MFSGVVDKLLTELKRKVFEKKKGTKFIEKFFKSVSQLGKGKVLCLFSHVI